VPAAFVGEVARTFCPLCILAPLTDMLAALALFASPWLQWLRTDIAKLYHFGYDETAFLRGQKR